MVTHTIQRINGRLMHCPPKTRSSRRMVMLDGATVTELRHHKVRQQEEAARLGFNPSGFVFTNRRGQPLNPDYLYREFMRAVEDVGMPPIRLHDLRHGAASLALAAGNELKVIQDQLGHASIVLTADTYVSVEPDLARKAAESTARLVLRDSRYVPGTHRVRRARATQAAR
jgi:integrase